MNCTDQEIIRQVNNGQKECFAELVRRYQQQAHKLALSVLRQPADAEDAVSEAFVKAFTALPRCRDDTNFKSWFLTITYNCCRDILRKRAKEGVPLADLAESSPGYAAFAAPRQHLPGNQRHTAMARRIRSFPSLSGAGKIAGQTERSNLRMKTATGCPEPELLLVWLDQETENPYIGEHIKQCSRCRCLAEKLRQENDSLERFFAELPQVHDLSAKVMRRLEQAPHRLNSLETAGACILILSAGILLALLYNFLTLSLFTPHGPQILTVLKILTFLTNAFLSLQVLFEYALTAVFSVQPLLPAMLVTVVLVLINILNKRRFSNV